MLPHNYKLEYSAEQIASRTKSIASEVEVWLKQHVATDPVGAVVVPVMRGGVFFFCDLVREINLGIEMAYMRSQSYEGDKFAALKPQVQYDISTVNAKNRSVLLVDDILDSGRSLATLKNALLQAGAREVKIAVLIRRSSAQHGAADWVGFDYSANNWLVGYGMDDRNQYCNLPQIYSIQA